jgi:hypothetical protein
LGFTAGDDLVHEGYMSHGFLYDGQIFSNFDPPNSTYTLATGINDLGVVVGNYQDFFSSLTEQNGFVASHAVVTDMPTPPSLPLFATGLGLMGLLGWRKRSGRINVGGR